MNLQITKVFRILAKGVLVLTGLFLLGFLGWTVYRGVKFRPYKVRVTNVTDSAFTVSWVTDSPMPGIVYYGEKDTFLPGPLAWLGKKKAVDDRDFSDAQSECVSKFNKEASKNRDENFTVDASGFNCNDIKVWKYGEYYTHHVTVQNLEAEKEYFFRVGDGFLSYSKGKTEGVVYVEREIPEVENFKQKTLPVITKVEAPNPAYGTSYNVYYREDGTMGEKKNFDSLIFLKTYKDGEVLPYLSSVTNSSGGWTIDLSNVRKADGTVVPMDGASLEFIPQVENAKPGAAGTSLYENTSFPLYLMGNNEQDWGIKGDSFGMDKEKEILGVGILSPLINKSFGAYAPGQWCSDNSGCTCWDGSFVRFALTCPNTGGSPNYKTCYTIINNKCESRTVNDNSCGEYFSDLGICKSKLEEPKKTKTCYSSSGTSTQVYEGNPCPSSHPLTSKPQPKTTVFCCNSNCTCGQHEGQCVTGYTKYTDKIACQLEKQTFCCNSSCSCSFHDSCPNGYSKYASVDACRKAYYDCFKLNSSKTGCLPYESTNASCPNGFTREDSCKSAIPSRDACKEAKLETSSNGVPVVYRGGCSTNNQCYYKYITNWGEVCEYKPAVGVNCGSVYCADKEPVSKGWGEECKSLGGCICPNGVIISIIDSCPKAPEPPKTPEQPNTGIVDPKTTCWEIINPSNVTTGEKICEDFEVSESTCPAGSYISENTCHTKIDPNERICWYINIYGECVPTGDSCYNQNGSMKEGKFSSDINCADKIEEPKMCYLYKWYSHDCKPVDSGFLKEGQDCEDYITCRDNNNGKKYIVNPQLSDCLDVPKNRTGGSKSFDDYNTCVASLYSLIAIELEGKGLSDELYLTKNRSVCCSYKENPQVWIPGVTDYKTELLSFDQCETMQGEYLEVSRCGVNDTGQSELQNKSIVRKAYAKDNLGKILYLPESGVYEVVTSEIGKLSLLGDNKYVFYRNRDGKSGYQQPVDLENIKDNEDILVNQAEVVLSTSQTVLSNELTFKKGINIVSFNFSPSLGGIEGMTSKDFLNLANKFSTNISRIAFFSAGQWNGGTLFDFEKNETKGESFDLIFGKGYVVVAEQDCTISIPGYKIESSVPLALSSGWNLVGVHGYSTAYTAKTFIESINTIEGLKANNVTWWPTSRGMYQGYQLQNGQEYGQDFPISPINGYFVRIAEFTPKEDTCKSLIWNPSGEMNGECGSNN